MRKNLQHQAPRVKGEGMLVVSIRGANYDFWYHSGCSGRNGNIFLGSKESFVVPHDEITPHCR